jgi:aspartyl-tRNA(Asn)/glutamyl-tRNA(Gln) amidotransferase subunit A
MTTTPDITALSLEDVAERIRAREVSPVEVTDAVLARIETLQPRLNAFVTRTGEQALALAREAEDEIAHGRYRGTLHGVPVAIKDLFETKGVRTTAGSKLRAHTVPDRDATVVRKLKEAGAISVGKLGMHEWAFGVTSDNMHFGPIRNPWDPERVPGGSSGGSGAAVTAGMAYAALGSDTGGSIRIPAALCGCVGFMPTYGRASLFGAIPLSWSLDHPGPLARTVRDAAVVMQAISGYDPLDPTTEDRPVPAMLDGIERGPRGLRVGVPKQYFWDNLEPEVEALVRKAISDLAGAGAEVRELEWPRASQYLQPTIAIMFADAAAYHAPTFPSRRDDYSPQVAALLDTGLAFTAVQYAAAAQFMREERGGGADSVLDGLDVLAVPTTPVVAPTIESVREADPAVRIASLTGVFDLSGQPVVAVPCGLTSANLPASISFVARRWDEPSALRAARAYELVRGPFPLPALSVGDAVR